VCLHAFAVARGLFESGTPVYLPPEVLREERVSLKLDVYSFGIILWELIARELPFQGMTLKEMVEAVSKHDVRPDVPDKCSDDLRVVITRCVYVCVCVRACVCTCTRALRIGQRERHESVKVFAPCSTYGLILHVTAPQLLACRSLPAALLPRCQRYAHRHGCTRGAWLPEGPISDYPSDVNVARAMRGAKDEDGRRWPGCWIVESGYIWCYHVPA
jgi:serine/threonine protein kinase